MSLSIFDLHADVFKVLANPKRLEIIHLIRDRELSVGELEEMLDMRQANISQHLTVLRDNKLVKTRRNGTHIYYSLSDIRLVEATDLIRDILKGRLKDSKNITGIFDGEVKDYLKEHIDPVCKMHVSAKNAADKVSYNNKDYYFCALGCKEKFSKNPVKYILMDKNLKETKVG